MRGVCLLIVLFSLYQVLLGARVTLEENEYQDKFTTWMHTHNKAYLSVDFFLKYRVFKDNVDFVNNWKGSHEVGLNAYSDLTPEQFAEIMLHPVATPTATPVTARDARHTSEQVDEEYFARQARATPTSVDWRTSGTVQAVKNQGQCGDCWAFATSGGVESITKISTGTLPSLSAQQLCDCVTDNSGCNGGNLQKALNYVIGTGGVNTDASYPYNAVQSTCKFNSANVGGSISGFTAVQQGSESALQTAVATQPVIISIAAGLQSFQAYKSGIFNDTACGTTGSDLNHAVMMIGYGTGSTGDYWILKNQWGTGWGMSGYMNIARNAGNRCGIASYAFAPTKGPIVWVFQDALGSGWSTATSGTVTALTACSAAQFGSCSYSATIAASSQLKFNYASLSTSGKSNLSFSVKSSAAGTLLVGLNNNQHMYYFSTTTTWGSQSFTLSQLGAPTTITSIIFQNYGSSTATFTFDTIFIN